MHLAKYNANGNDFLIFHTFRRKNRADLARRLCERHSGVGADGLVVLLPHAKYAYEWDFYNADGSKAAMCGNASRCVAHYAVFEGLAGRDHSFLSGAGEIGVSVRGAVVETSFGRVRMLECGILRGGLEFSLLDSGVPHLVAFVRKKSEIPSQKNAFLRDLRVEFNANVSLAYIVEGLDSPQNSKSQIALATFERGVEDITLACGTGAAAVFYAAFDAGKIAKTATLLPPSGESMECHIEGDCVFFKARVERVGEVWVKG